ncbi:alpha/beta fold hydrolase [Actinomadura rupiterrae]|uniref:alpha/beta fold hydrolase n=1 Tax=Actinomadura rupiterrae TaxID=559627 RepID=UPI0020A313F6|nr:alpha/beta fold hydrolase [Actinomadura rupiterrae]MCP2336263.1 pimeloyl-ACP methyl ester carboxylesterase [Actinomadura rupiterrae]
MSTGYAQVNGLKMYYEEHGDGSPVVLLHGGVLTVELSFSSMLPELAKRHRVIAPELQGHGHTADIERPITVGALAEDVRGLLDHLGVERAAVFGFSLGGFVALQLAMAHPERVTKAVVASAQVRPDGMHPEISDPERWAESRRMPTEDDFREMRETYLKVAPHPEYFEAFMAKTSAAAQSFQGWSDDEVRGIAVPTLIVVGDEDFVTLEHAVEMREMIPDAQLAVLPDTTHQAVTHRPELIPIIERFLS